MSSLRIPPIDADKLAKATSPFHVNVSNYDRDRIIEAYPSLLVQEVMSEFNEQTNEYIAKELVRLDIDKDVLIKQTQEIRRLNTDMQKVCDRAYQQGRADAIEEIYKKADEKIKEQIEYLNRIPQRNGKMWAIYMANYLEQIKTVCEQLKEQK